jgi:hypothetical protein
MGMFLLALCRPLFCNCIHHSSSGVRKDKTGGTDYNSNPRGKSLGMSRKVVSKVEVEMQPDAFMAKVCDPASVLLRFPY